MPALLYRSAIIWTALGLASGLFYREFTKLNGVPGGTQLAVVHTHTLTLGTILSLLLLALVASWPVLARQRQFRIGVWLWQVGLALTTFGLLVKGCLQVLGREAANSPMIAGVSGLGHMTLAAAFAFLLTGLAPMVRATSGSGELGRVA